MHCGTTPAQATQSPATRLQRQLRKPKRCLRAEEWCGWGRGAHAVVVDGAVRCRVLQQRAADVLGKVKGALRLDHHLQAKAAGAALAHLNCLRVTLVLRDTRQQ
jgi:hypothetical protein